jgi:hypothetical protein
MAKPKDRTESYLEGECDACGARKNECACDQEDPQPAPPVEPDEAEDDWRKYL